MGLNRLYKIATHHTYYNETNPYIVIAGNESEARVLVEATDTYQEDRNNRLRRGEDSGITDIEEIDLGDSMVILGVYNAG